MTDFLDYALAGLFVLIVLAVSGCALVGMVFFVRDEVWPAIRRIARRKR